MFGLMKVRTHRDILAQLEGIAREGHQLAEGYRGALVMREREVEALRQELVHQQNVAAELRGRLVAEAHAAGQPAPSI